jgi:hypothetical protein
VIPLYARYMSRPNDKIIPITPNIIIPPINN